MEKRDVDPNATIQLDALDDVELEDSTTSQGPQCVAPEPAVAQSMDARSRSRTGKGVPFFAMLVALIALAIAAGFNVGGRVRDKLSPVPASGAAALSAAATTPPQATSPRTLIVPTVEIHMQQGQ